MFKKAFSALILFFFLQMSSNASNVSNSINEIINSFDFDKDSIVSISVKNKKTGILVYEKNGYKYLNPASVLKLFTMAASIDTLGENYSFDTAFWRDDKNNLYLKLSGDPYLTEADLNELALRLKNNYKGRINKIYIDDSIIDTQSYPDGWTVDDYWPNSPKLSPYTVDFNTVKVDFILSEDKNSVRIVQNNDYKFSFVNKLVSENSNNIKLSYDELHNTVNVEGTINSNVLNKEIPVLNPKYFFCNKLNKALNKNGINFSNKFLFAKVPANAVLTAEFSRPIDEVVKKTLATSNNMAAETIFKTAGHKYAEQNSEFEPVQESFGTTQNGINMFIEYCKKLNLDTEHIKIRDGSGVSRYNALNVNWMSNALLKMNFDFEKYLPTGGEGTLSKRMREMAGSVYFKTGTLFGTSSLLGIIKTKNEEYVWASVIMSYNRNKSLIRGIEDEMVYEIYRAGEDE